MGISMLPSLCKSCSQHIQSFPISRSWCYALPPRSARSELEFRNLKRRDHCQQRGRAQWTRRGPKSALGRSHAGWHKMAADSSEIVFGLVHGSMGGSVVDLPWLFRGAHPWHGGRCGHSQPGSCSWGLHSPRSVVGSSWRFCRIEQKDSTLVLLID